MNKNQKLIFFASWWRRIILFINLSMLTTIAYYYLNITTSPYFFIIFPITILFVSYAIEKQRVIGSLKTLGLQFDRFTLKHVLMGFLFVLTSILIIFLFLMLFNNQFIINTNISKIGLNNYLLFLSTTFCWAFLEEIIFRGIIFQSINERFGGTTAVIIISLIFAGLHFFNPGFSFSLPFINLILASILLSLMYLRTKSLWMPISFHYFWNIGIVLFLGSNLSGTNYSDYSIITFGSFTPTIIFGSTFGIEGGIITTLILCLLCLLTTKYAAESPFITSLLFYRKYKESLLFEI